MFFTTQYFNASAPELHFTIPFIFSDRKYRADIIHWLLYKWKLSLKWYNIRSHIEYLMLNEYAIPTFVYNKTKHWFKYFVLIHQIAENIEISSFMLKKHDKIRFIARNLILIDSAICDRTSCSKIYWKLEVYWNVEIVILTQLHIFGKKTGMITKIEIRIWFRYRQTTWKCVPQNVRISELRRYGQIE